MSFKHYGDAAFTCPVSIVFLGYLSVVLSHDILLHCITVTINIIILSIPIYRCAMHVLLKSMKTLCKWMLWQTISQKQGNNQNVGKKISLNK